MNITAIKTEKILPHSIKLENFLDRYIKKLENNSVVAITSKVISIIESNIEPKSCDLRKLILNEAEHYFKEKNRYGRNLTIKCNAFISAAGIDQSNGNDCYVLCPKNPQKTAREIYQYLSKKFKTKEFGIIITDSRSLPLRAGATGVAIGFHGFSPLKNYIGKKDIFGRKFVCERANLADGLAAMAVLCMGEGAEQTPLAIIEDVNSIKFSDKYPSKQDLKEFYISKEKDFFHQFYK